MDYSELEGFLATSIPTPEFNKPPFAVEASQTESGAYIISLVNVEKELGMQVANDGPEGYEHAVKIFNALEARWNGLAVLLKGDLHGAENCNLIAHALREFKAVGYPDLSTMEDESMDKLMITDIIQLLYVFSQQEHSGSSAPYAISAFTKLANFEPLGPLTGEDPEWLEVEPGLFQNIRCGHVFMDATTGQAYDAQGKIFREPDGSTFQSSDSRVYITFPYTPTVEYVDVPALDGVDHEG